MARPKAKAHKITAKLTREDMAFSAFLDAGNRSMRKAGRSTWSAEDQLVAAREYHRVYPCPPDINCELCTWNRAHENTHNRTTEGSA